MITKNKFFDFLRCPKRYALSLSNPELRAKTAPADTNLAAQGILVGEAARAFFGAYAMVDFSDHQSMVEQTETLMKNSAVKNIAEASFMSGDIFCSADLLRKNGSSVEIYEVKASASLRPEYIMDAAYQYYAISRTGVRIEKVCILYLNAEYVRCGDIDLRELFVLANVTAAVLEKQNEIDKVARELQRLSLPLRGETNAEIGVHCHAPDVCAFWELCVGALPFPNVFDLAGGTRTAKKFEFFSRGIISFQDIYASAKAKTVKLSDKALKQVAAEVENKPVWIDSEKISLFLGEVRFPLYFLDFETVNLALPPFDGTKPFQQIPFQYSLHILTDRFAQPIHLEYLADPNRNWLAEIVGRLCADIPKDAPVIAYNMKFEKGCLKMFATAFPQYAAHLMAIHDNMIDLMAPFQNQHYYLKAMNGSFSIKSVLPALFPDEPSLNYANLSGIHNGLEAMETFTKLKNMEPALVEKMRRDMLKYCELDTFAMVKILEKLFSLVE